MTYKNHILHECNKEDCYTCRGGLASCTVCHGAEGTLPTHCPDRPLTDAETDAIMAGTLDYIKGKWWRSVTPTPKAMRETPETKKVVISEFDPDDSATEGIVDPKIASEHAFQPGLHVFGVQTGIHAWMLETMGAEVTLNKEERNWRVAEEFCELLHATGMPLEDLVIMAMTTYKKNEGKTSPVVIEIADASFCLNAMASAYGINLEKATVYMLQRNWERAGTIRNKHKTKLLKSRARVAE